MTDKIVPIHKVKPITYKQLLIEHLGNLDEDQQSRIVRTIVIIAETDDGLVHTVQPATHIYDVLGMLELSKQGIINNTLFEEY